MDEGTKRKPRLNALPMDGVLAPYASDYNSELIQGRYAAATRHAYLCCIGHFARWLTAERRGLEGVNGEAGRRFVTEHLPRCDCPPPFRRSPHIVNAALSHLYDVLGKRDALVGPSGSLDHIHTEIAAFDQYMDKVCGLAAKTRRQRVLMLTRFLSSRFGSGPVVVSAITASDLRQFVLGPKSAAPRGTGLARVMGGALRCYLRFRALAGDPVQLLSGTIPRPANRRLTALPVVLSKSEVKQLLASFDKSLPSARRAYAIVRCLADLGLRASEVVHITLDDIDWQAGTIRIAKGKCRRTDILPLPFETGRAIAEYLRTERPTTANRAVFVRHVAPFDDPITVGVVHTTVKAAYRRCGWTHTRPHILRHSVASQLLQEGTPLKEIADVLRHRSLNTSTIYVKVDAIRLSAVALPWPGRTA
jgi:integrase/recombinase XerD